MIRIALLLWAALMLAMPATAQVGVAPPSGFIVAATQGQTSVTGTTTGANLAALRIPAGSMGRNGHIEVKCLWTYSNSANVKTTSVQFSQTSGSGGSFIAGNLAVTTTASAQTLTIIRNNNATNSQTAFAPNPSTPFGSTASASLTAAIDTTADSFVNINGQLAVSTDTLTLVHAYAVVFPAN